MRRILFIALRNFRDKNGRFNRRMTASIVGIGLSLVPLVVVLQISGGMIDGITTRFLETGTYHFQAYGYSNMDAADYSAAAEVFENMSEVRQVIPEIQGLGLIYSRQSRLGITIRAVPENLWETDSGFRKYMNLLEGNFDLSDDRNCVLGKEVASRLGVGPGSDVKLMTTRSISKTSLVPRVSTFRVVGVVATGYQDLDKLWVYIPFSKGQRILSPESSRQFIGIKIKHPGKEDQAFRTVAQEKSGLRIFSWKELERSQYMSFSTTRALLIFIMALVVLVAAINISSSLVMVVLERQDEIAILKSCGTSHGYISGSFLVTGLIIGILGTAFGMIVGVFGAVNINEIIVLLEQVLNWFTGRDIAILNPDFYLETIPITLNQLELFIVAVSAIIAAVAASVMPSLQAGRVKPLEVLQRH